jgi:hypothetical protein
MENSNKKAFGVNDLKPNKSGLIPGKATDGETSGSPLDTVRMPRAEVDDLIALAKEAKQEEAIYNPHPLGEEVGTVLAESFAGALDSLDEYSDSDSTEDFYEGEAGDLIEYIDVRLINLEKRYEDLEERIREAFKHAGFDF